MRGRSVMSLDFWGGCQAPPVGTAWVNNRIRAAAQMGRKRVQILGAGNL